MKILISFVFMVYSGIASAATSEHLSLKQSKSVDITDDNEILITIELNCNESFFKVLREEIVLGDTVLISVGVLARVNDAVDCNATLESRFVSAGIAYSGRKFVLAPIAK